MFKLKINNRLLNSKRYLVFAGNSYEGTVGLEDFFGSVDCKTNLIRLTKSKLLDILNWISIYDTQTCIEVSCEFANPNEDDFIQAVNVVWDELQRRIECVNSGIGFNTDSVLTVDYNGVPLESTKIKDADTYFSDLKSSSIFD